MSLSSSTGNFEIFNFDEFNFMTWAPVNNTDIGDMRVVKKIDFGDMVVIKKIDLGDLTIS